MRNEGKTRNHKRVYKSVGLSLRRKVKKRLPARVKEPLEVLEVLNHTWSMDFGTDVLDNNRRFRGFNVVDDYNNHRPHDSLGKIPPIKYAKNTSSGASPRRSKNNNFIEILEN